VRILVAGDSFMPVEVFRRAFAALEPEHEIRYIQMDAARVLAPATPSEKVIREFEGHPAQLAELLAGEQVLIVHGAPVTGAVLDAAPSLELVGCARGGPVNVDVGAATARGVAVAHTPGKNAESVADLTLAFLVMLARGIRAAQEFLLAGGELGGSNFEGAQFLGDDLGGRVLGLVGFGQVGRRVALRALAFGMDVLVHDPFVEPSEATDVRFVDLDELLAGSDFVSLHARASADNEQLFDASAFAAMKPGAAFVNTARASLVDEEALVQALESGHLAGVALDVVRPRPDGSRHPLIGHRRAVITPHIGGATHQTLARGAQMLADEIARLAAGQAPGNVVNREALVKG
jgi:D-3-phosphoglycerate dehydrogenase